MKLIRNFIFFIAAIMVLIMALTVRAFPIATIIFVILIVSLVRNKRKEEQERTEEHREARSEEDRTEQAQRTQAPHYERVSSIITCDYCGSLVDTDKYTCCSHCGGPFYDDIEWKKIRESRRYSG